MKPKVILIHGSLECTKDSFWLPYVAEKLRNKGLEVISETFPDNQLARAEYWIPFLTQLHPDEHTILIGHSSGAILSMRYAQNHKILGSVLVSAYHTDLGDEDEKKSGYFTKPWEWENIKRNQQWILQFASSDDPFIPIAEARFIKEKLDTTYYEYTNEGHFGIPVDKKEFPELIEAIEKKIK